MPTAPRSFSARPSRTKVERDGEADNRRGSARKRGYTTAWDKARAGYIRGHPFCEYCTAGAFGAVHTAPAQLVDHLYPHRGDRELFWDTRWWVASCEACHAGPKQRAEHRGTAVLDALARHLGRPERVGGGGV
jgi:5-methylcytosine-specific restriction protein A